MSIKEENIIKYEGTLKAGQRFVKIGNAFMPVGIGGAKAPEGGGDGNNMKFYKCASVNIPQVSTDTETPSEPEISKTWSGYELILLDGAYVVSDVLTENLKYTFITPMVESYYSEDGLLQLKDFYNGTVLVSPTGMTSAENDEWVIFADSEYGSGYASFIAFSGSDTEETGWVSGDKVSLPHWIQWQNKQKNVKITEYAMQVNRWVELKNRERFPCSWELQGSINGNDWVTVDSRTDAFSSVDELKTWEYYTFTCQNPGYYSFYRIYVTGVVDRNESEYVYIGQIKAYGQFEEGEGNETPPDSKPYGYRLRFTDIATSPVWEHVFVMDDVTAEGFARTWTSEDGAYQLYFDASIGWWMIDGTNYSGAISSLDTTPWDVKNWFDPNTESDVKMTVTVIE
jgi:hypothetical protein